MCYNNISSLSINKERKNNKIKIFALRELCKYKTQKKKLIFAKYETHVK